jgi:YARHG domain
MRLLITAGLTALTLGAALAPSYAASCQNLWVERNTYYKAGGYCFKTLRAIRYFGNAGCRYDNENAVPLTAAEQRRIAEIVIQERIQGCSD